jgi:hypothetical protein
MSINVAPFMAAALSSKNVHSELLLLSWVAAHQFQGFG